MKGVGGRFCVRFKKGKIITKYGEGCEEEECFAIVEGGNRLIGSEV